jgi:translation initiation factor 2B subunit (eIF-2B alpha/beta/delta family)
LIFGVYFMESATVKDAKKIKKPRNFGKKAAATTVMVLGVSMFGVIGAKATTLQDLQNLLSEVGTVINAVNQVTAIAESFSNVINNFSNITDLSGLRGALGQFSPIETIGAVNKPSPNDLAGLATAGVAEAATTSLAANQVLSKPAQEATKKTKDEMQKLDQASQDASKQVIADGQSAQTASSTQNVLKLMSSQLSGQTAIQAAQVRLLTLQNNSNQELLTQLAAANTVNASSESRKIAEERMKLDQKRQELNSLIKSMSTSFMTSFN